MALHIGIPLIIARLFFSDKWLLAWIIMISAFIIDIDHLLAVPVYSPGRCSVGFHPLHSWYAIGVYIIMLAIPYARIRLFAIGLIIHISVDFLDCIIRLIEHNIIGQFITGFVCFFKSVVFI